MRGQVIPVVETQVSGEQNTARGAKWLTVKDILWRHAHQDMREAERAGRVNAAAVRAMGAKCVGHTIEIALVHRLAVESQNARDGAHRPN